MNPKRSAPKPILDNLDAIGEPRKQQHFNVSPFFAGDPVPGADIDYECALKFLASYDGSKATFNSYRRDIERLLQWAWRIENTAAFKLKREDIEAFIKFCCDPPKAWMGTVNVARFKNENGQRVPNPRWRPFTVTQSKAKNRAGDEVDKDAYVMKSETIKALLAILKSFYDYLLDEDLIVANPVARIRQKSKFIKKEQSPKSVYRLSNIQWDYLIETAEKLAEEDPDIHERTLFVMNCLYAMYLRISELVADGNSIPLMNSFQRDSDKSWWFHVTGKGNKDRKIVVSDAMLKALKRYRRFRGLPPLPSLDDIEPLVPKRLGKGPMRSTRHLREIIQGCFDKAYEQMLQDGLEEDAGELRSATVHWLRHTGISEDVKNRPREHVRDDAGHSSFQTTEKYIDVEDRERHQSGKKKLIKEV